MDMKQCGNGHYFDADKNVACPYCDERNSISVTRPLDIGETVAGTASINQSIPAFPKTTPVGQSASLTSPSIAKNYSIPPTTPVIGGESGKTMALHLNEVNIDPVRGWLVCIEGKKKGKDFKIQSERNFIGRSKGNHICLEFDSSISKDRHAILTYDLKTNSFWIQIGEGLSSIYLNDQIVLTPMILHPYDVITIGETNLSFVPFCTESFKW